MSLCNEHRFLSKSLQHTISMSGHEAFSAWDTNSPSSSPSNAPSRFENLIPNVFVWHLSFWTQLQKKNTFWIWIMILIKYLSTSSEVVKGQLNPEWIYEVIVSPKMQTKNYKDFCHTKQTRIVALFLVIFWWV